MTRMAIPCLILNTYQQRYLSPYVGFQDELTKAISVRLKKAAQKSEPPRNFEDVISPRLASGLSTYVRYS
jgi:hypothetical protein